MIDERDRRIVADRAVWPNFIVVSTPSLHPSTGIFKAHEPMGVQAFRSELAVEAFNERIVRRFAGTAISEPFGVLLTREGILRGAPMKKCVSGLASISVLLIGIALATVERAEANPAASFYTQCGANRACLVWAQFRKERPFPHQAFAVGKADDGAVVVIISEPPATLPKNELEKLVRTTFGADFVGYTTRRWAVGIDGWLEDVVVQLKPMALANPLQDPVLRDRLGFLHEILWGTTFGATAENANAKYSDVAHGLVLNISLTPAELRQWTEHAKGDWISLDARARGQSVGLQAILSSQHTGSYMDGGRQLVMLTIPHRVLGSAPTSAAAIEEMRLPFRRFAVASDIVLGGVWNKNGDLAIVARSRRTPQAAVPPLRFESFADLVRVNSRELVQSYERTNLFAGRLQNGPYNGLDWAPILLSSSLVNSEFGVLLDVTDQLLKSWSEAGNIRYFNFNYPLQPVAGRFVFGAQPLSALIYQEIGGRSVLFNWNTAGSAVAMNDKGFTTLAAGRTGALPVTYGSDALGPSMRTGNELPELRAREEVAFTYFSERQDPNLARVVSYTLIYQAIQGALAESGLAQLHPAALSETANTLVLVNDAEFFLAAVEANRLLPRPGTDADAFYSAMNNARRGLADFYATQHIDRHRLAVMIAMPQGMQVLLSKAGAPLMTAADQVRSRSEQVNRRIDALNKAVEANTASVNKWLTNSKLRLRQSVSSVAELMPYLPENLRDQVIAIERERIWIKRESAAITLDQQWLNSHISRMNDQAALQGLNAAIEGLRPKLSAVAQLTQDLDGIRTTFVKAGGSDPTGRIRTPSIVLSSNASDVNSVGGHNLGARTLRIDVDPSADGIRLEQSPDGSPVLRVPASMAGEVGADAYKFARTIEHDKGAQDEVERIAHQGRPKALRAEEAVLGRGPVDLAQMDCNLGCTKATPSRAETAELFRLMAKYPGLAASLQRNRQGYFIAMLRDGTKLSCCTAFADSKSLEDFVRLYYGKGGILMFGENDTSVRELLEGVVSNDQQVQASVRGAGIIQEQALGRAENSFQFLTAGTANRRPLQITFLTEHRAAIISAAFEAVDLTRAELGVAGDAEGRFDHNNNAPPVHLNDERGVGRVVFSLKYMKGHDTMLAKVTAFVKRSALGRAREVFWAAINHARKEKTLVELQQTIMEQFNPDEIELLEIETEQGVMRSRTAENTTSPVSAGLMDAFG